jgi:hypothetical protein
MKYSFDKAQHVHTLDGRPLTGVSTVGSVVGKGGLTWWAVGLALKKLGWTNPKFTDKQTRLEKAGEAFDVIRNLPHLEYLSLLDDCYKAHDVEKKESAKRGTARHKLVEEYVKSCINGDEQDAPEEIQSFVKWAKENVKKFLWSEAHSFSEKHWVGGISDIGAELKDGNIAVIDIKSSKTAYPEMFFQCGGYDLLISENGLWTADGEKIADPITITRHIIFPFGAENPTAVIREDVGKNREAFLHELALYLQIQNYKQ